jgi:recombination endonuclease VII
MTEADPTAWAWTPPEGMTPILVTGWRNFYRHAFMTYGVTPRFYRALYLAQSGRCFICRTARGMHPDDPKGGGGRRLGIDHNHLIGNRIEAVRGLLCTGSLSANTCNRLIARYDVSKLRRAVEMLHNPPAQRLIRMDEMSDEALIGVLT